jgi:hypothetical protein
MVRLVFRPYTQIWRSICTSESLRASIRVSSDFTLFRHSSPSFGSQHTCSYSTMSSNAIKGRSMLPNLNKEKGRILIKFYFHYAHGFIKPKYSHACWTPWSVFQDGSIGAFSPTSKVLLSLNIHEYITTKPTSQQAVPESAITIPTKIQPVPTIRKLLTHTAEFTSVATTPKAS